MRRFDAIKANDIIGDMKVRYTFRDEKNNRQMCKCVCLKCGRKRDVYEGNLRDKPASSDHAITCGFGLKKQIDIKFYNVWAKMKDRIYNPNNVEYYRYGGRGLTTDYDAFIDFYDDMYTKYMEAKRIIDKPTLDRINNDLGYVRGNLRWTTYQTQTRNSTTVREFIAISPEGYYFITNNQTMFAKNHYLEPKHISDCLRKVQATTGGGWRFRELYEPEIDGPFIPNWAGFPWVIKEYYY